MCKPLVSVVIPYHGSTPEHFLARALRDAKIQTCPNVEIVVVTNRAMQLPFSKDPFYLYKAIDECDPHGPPSDYI